MNSSTIALEKPPYFKTIYIFSLLILGIWLNIWLFQNLIMTREVYYNLLSERIEITRIDDYFNFIQKFSIWSYITAPFLLLIRLLFFAILIQFPLLFKFIDIPLKQIFRITCYGYIPLFIMGLIKNLWLLQLSSSTITEQMLAFTPLALTNFINVNLYSKLIYGLLSNFNLFEVFWCAIIIKGLNNTKKLSKLDATLIVVVVWIAILFFQWALIMYLMKINS